MLYNRLFLFLQTGKREGKMKGEKSFRSVAKDAKRRLKSGFWEDCEAELHTELARAREAGVSESRAARYFTDKIALRVAGGDDEAFYARVRAMLLAEGEVSDAIGRLTDRAYYDTLSYEEKQRYTLNLSERYLRALERFRRECEFESL